MSKRLKKGTFVESGQAICISIVAIYAAWGFLGDYFMAFLKGFLPIMFFLLGVFYLFWKLELE